MKQRNLLFAIFLCFVPMFFCSAVACVEGIAGRVMERASGPHQGKQDLVAAGDFDGDGSMDRAYFVEKEGKYSLCASLDDEKRIVKLLELRRDIWNKGIRTASPGLYISPCARYMNCSSDEAVELELVSDAIEYLTYESGANLFYWRDNRFHAFWISD